MWRFFWPTWRFVGAIASTDIRVVSPTPAVAEWTKTVMQ
jgi:hypothetical protein